MGEGSTVGESWEGQHSGGALESNAPESQDYRQGESKDRACGFQDQPILFPPLT